MALSWQERVVLVAAALFTGFLLWKYRPTFALPRLPRRSEEDLGTAGDWARRIREARESARNATTPRERAASLVVAAQAAAMGHGETSAMGLYLRAMRADATFCDPIVGLTELLRGEQPDLLETVLWRRLSHLPWTGETVPAVRCAAQALVSLYRRELRHRDRARALQKLVGHLR